MSDKSTIWEDLQFFIGPSTRGVRFWWIATIVVFAILILLPPASLALLVIAKLSMLLTGLCSIAMGGLGIWNGLNEKITANEKSKPRKETSFVDYLFKDLLGEWFKKGRNQAQFVFGLLLAVILAALLICACPGLDILAGSHIPFLEHLLDSLRTILASLQEPISLAFDGVLSPTTTWWIAGTFFSAGLLTLYDSLCCAAQIAWPMDEEDGELTEDHPSLVINDGGGPDKGGKRIFQGKIYSRDSVDLMLERDGDDDSSKEFNIPIARERKDPTFNEIW